MNRRTARRAEAWEQRWGEDLAAAVGERRQRRQQTLVSGAELLRGRGQILLQRNLLTVVLPQLCSGETAKTYGRTGFLIKCSESALISHLCWRRAGRAGSRSSGWRWRWRCSDTWRLNEHLRPKTSFENITTQTWHTRITWRDTHWARLTEPRKTSVCGRWRSVSSCHSVTGGSWRSAQPCREMRRTPPLDCTHTHTHQFKKGIAITLLGF